MDATRFAGRIKTPQIVGLFLFLVGFTMLRFDWLVPNLGLPMMLLGIASPGVASIFHKWQNDRKILAARDALRAARPNGCSVYEIDSSRYTLAVAS